MQLVPLNSDRIIKYAGYEATRQKLYIGYTKGGCYVFSPVPEHLYAELVASDRPYDFFASHIQGAGFRYARSDVDYMAQLLDYEREQNLQDLATWNAEQAIRQADHKQRAEAEQTTREYWVRLSGWQFERQVATVFRSHGFVATVTRGSGDGGVDIRLTKGTRKIIVQCKNHQKPIGPSVVRELFGVLVHERADSAILVAAGGFSPSARTFARNNPILLLQLEDLIRIRDRSHKDFERFAESGRT